MGIHHLTLEKIQENQAKFNDKLYKEIEAAIKLATDYSPLSDFYFLIQKVGLQLSQIKTTQDRSDWIPVRNVLRIIANTASLEIDSRIAKVEIESMRCGCDYFEGTFKLTMENGEILAGPYKWQWSAFNDREKHFEKFTVFPKVESTVLSKRELIAN